MAAEHEDQAHCVGDSGSIDPDHSPLRLPWLQLWEVNKQLLREEKRLECYSVCL